MVPKDLEIQIARETAAGREMLAVLQQVRRNLSGPQRLAKAFELTETTREIMRSGIRADHPEWNEAEVQAEFVDRMLKIHGFTLAEIRRRQAAENGQTRP